MIPRGRILRASQADVVASSAVRAGLESGGGARRAMSGQGAAPAGHIARRSLNEAVAESRRLLAEAEMRARQIVADAEREAGEIRGRVYEEARQESAAELAIAWTRLRAQEASREEREVERTVGLARAMAERLLGDALTSEPERIRAMAQQSLALVRQAHSVHLFANPADAAVLQAEIGALGLEASVLRIHADTERPRGSLLLRTDLGTLDADLPLQLDRLAAALRANFPR